VSVRTATGMEQPPIVTTAVNKRRMKPRFYILLLVAVALVAVAVRSQFVLPRRPTDNEFLQAFNKNRAAFEQLRDMFRADNSVKLRRVADWGIETWKPVFKGKPTAADFPMQRYQQYLRLLHQVGSPQALTATGGDPTITIWASGWFGHWRHIDISWMDEVPTNQVSNLDQCRVPKWDGQHFYRHIDEQWYLDTNMGPF